MSSRVTIPDYDQPNRFSRIEACPRYHKSRSLKDLGGGIFQFYGQFYGIVVSAALRRHAAALLPLPPRMPYLAVRVHAA